MKKQMILLLSVFVLLFTPACSLGNDIARRIEFSTDSGVNVKSLTGSGNIVTEDRPVSDFDQIVLTGLGEMIITQGDTESLTIEADDDTPPLLDMLLAKKRASDRKTWLEEKGNLAEV